MALTNFALLTDEQKTVWSMDLWQQARNQSFINKFIGDDDNSIIQRVGELTKTAKGNRAVLTLLADLVGDGVAGDRTLEGNEEAMKTYDQVIRFDQLRHANRLEGRMADQKSIVRFRENSRNRLAYWLADRLDQMAFLTLAGRAYSLTNNGATRVGSDLPSLEFAADVTAPTSQRVYRWDATTGLMSGNDAVTTDITTADTPTWELFVELKAKAKTNYVRGIKTGGGEEVYHCFLTPQAMAKLKLDETYMLNVRHAKERGDNDLFSGSSVKIDGIVFHEFRHVYNTADAAAGSKWGNPANVDGCQILFCGAQALGMADIGNAYWEEKDFDYGNQAGISVGKMVGFLKPKFNSLYAGNTVQDFGVISVFVAQ